MYFNTSLAVQSHCGERTEDWPRATFGIAAPNSSSDFRTNCHSGKSFRPSDIDEGLIKEESVLEGVPRLVHISRNYTPS
mgnify:CR=1 FL=1